MMIIDIIFLDYHHHKLKVMVMMIIDLIFIDDDDDDDDDDGDDDEAFRVLQSKSVCTIITADSAQTSISLVH